MKNNIKFQKLIKMMALAVTINASVLTTVSCACSKRSNDNIVDKNQDGVDEDSHEFKVHLTESKLITKSFLLSRYKQWDVAEVLTNVVPTLKNDFDNYFDNETIKKSFLTDSYADFNQPNYKINKTAVHLSLIKSLLNFIVADSSSETITKELIKLLKSTKMANTLIETELKKVKDLIIKLKETLTNSADDYNNKNFREIFKNIPVVNNDDIKTQISKIIPILPVLLSFFNEIISNAVESNDSLELAKILDKNYQNFDKLKLSKFLNDFRFLINDEKKMVSLLKLLNDADFPFANEVKMLMSFLLENKKYVDYIEEIIDTNLISKVNQIIPQFLKVLNSLTDSFVDDKFDFSKFITSLGIKDDSEKFETDSFLEFIVSLSTEQWSKNIIKEVLNNDNIWKEDGDYKTDFINNNNVIEFMDEDIEKDVNSNEFIIMHKVKVKRLLTTKNDQNLTVKWKISYTNTNKFSNMKIVSFDLTK